MTVREFREISKNAQATKDGRLTVHGWDTASLSSAALLALEAEAPALLGWREGVPIVTCQRYEFVSLDDAPAGSAPRVYEGREALLHLASLAAGLDSLVLGETQVFGQVRTALAKAPPSLRRAAAPALAAARSLRRENAFTGHAGHALDLALERADVPAEGCLLVLGGGVMARRIAERGAQLGFTVTIAARRPVQGLAATYLPLDGLANLPGCDVLAGCLGAGAPRLGRADLPPVARLAVDFGTPRNLADDLSAPVVTIAGLLAYQSTLPDLEARRSQLRNRLRELLDSRLVMASTDSSSPLGSLRGEVETIRRRELARAARLHPDLPLAKLDTITRSLVNQIFHRPSLRLRRSANQELAEQLAALFQAGPSTAFPQQDDDDR